MTQTELEVGTIIVHPKRPEWGPGKVLANLAGGVVVVYFRDLSEAKLGDAVKKMSTRHVPLEIAAEQTDPLLDNLPPWTEKKGFKGQKRPRLSFEAALEDFIDAYPGGASNRSTSVCRENSVKMGRNDSCSRGSAMVTAWHRSCVINEGAALAGCRVLRRMIGCY